MPQNQDPKSQPKLERIQFDVPKDGTVDDMVDAIMKQLPTTAGKDETKDSPKPED